MSFIPGMAGVAAFMAGPLPASVVMTDHQTSAAGTASYTFTVDTGPGVPKKLFFGVSGAVAGGAARTVTATVDDEDATQIVANQNGNSVAAMFAIDIPGNIPSSSASVTVTWSGVVSNVGIGIFAAYNLQSIAAHDSDSGVTNAASLSINVPENGIVVGYKEALRSAGASPTFTWTGLTERFDEQIVANSNSHTGACDEFATAQTVSVSSVASSFANGVILAASFR